MESEQVQSEVVVGDSDLTADTTDIVLNYVVENTGNQNQVQIDSKFNEYNEISTHGVVPFMSQLEEQPPQISSPFPPQHSHNESSKLMEQLHQDETQNISNFDSSTTSYSAEELSKSCQDGIQTGVEDATTPQMLKKYDSNGTGFGHSFVGSACFIDPPLLSEDAVHTAKEASWVVGVDSHINDIITGNNNETTEMESPMETITEEPVDSKFLISPSCKLTCSFTASRVFVDSREENYLRGCKWSPDGTQVLTNSNDNILRIFTPSVTVDSQSQEMTVSSALSESGLVYDFAWYPGKIDHSPSSCRVACSCPGSPIHLWDSNTGHLVSSFKAFDHCDELTSAYSLSFSEDGSKLYGGYKNCIRIFDTEYSHRRCYTIKTFDSKSREGQRGIISCFCHGPPESRTFVAGSYSRHVGIYHSLTNELLCLLQGQQGGITHVMMSPDGGKLYTGGRKDPEIVCWDMRNTGQILCTYLRDVQTNQRIYFDLSQSGRYLASGNHDGSVQVWDTLTPGQEVDGEVIVKPCYTFQAHQDCTNGVSFQPHSFQLATASGQRHFRNFDFDSGSDSDSDDSGTGDCPDVQDFSLKIWTIPCV